MMYVDFSECEFINNEMSYYTYYDFCNNCSAIKRLFKKLTNNGKRFYLWYVYANTHMKEFHKNAIWDYLNFDEPEYYNHLIQLEKQYKVR